MKPLGDLDQAEINATFENGKWVVKGTVFGIGVSNNHIPIGKKTLSGEDLGELLREFGDYVEALDSYFKIMYRKEKVENEG